MLQQTRVDTVVPYYGRFMERFPDARALAAASEDEVLAAWSGLGYYRRARMLHAGVKDVVERYGGEVPRGPEERRSLPGVGRYTAGAIGSIAFDAAEPIVDGNVARVLARIHAIDGELGRAATDRALWSRAAELVEGPRPGDLNQALMELGATVCVPRAPDCDACPVHDACIAHGEDRVAELPVPKKKKPPRDVQLVAVVATSRGSIALTKTEGALFRGLWALPTAEGSGRDAAREALRTHGVSARLEPRARGLVEHRLSHRHLRVEVWRATHARGARPVANDALDELGISTLTRKLLACAEL